MKIEKDLRHDLFRVTSRARVEDLVAAIGKLGYTATPAPADSFSTAAPVTTAPPPPIIQAALDRAKGKSRVLVLLVGDDCSACARMSAETLPAVRKLLDQLVFLEINVDHDKESARWFSAPGVPESTLFDVDGKVIRCVAGFVAPDDFAHWLTK